MPRTARLAAGGVCYHVINRGNARATVFRTQEDYRRFLGVLGEAQARLPLEVFAACLMPNHFHLVVRAQNNGDIGRWMQWCLTTHVRRHHARYESSGRIWQGRYKVFPIEQDDHLLVVMRYVERNALRAALVGKAEEWRWGSLAWRCNAEAQSLLSEAPIVLPSNWDTYVNTPQTTTELAALRTCVNRQRPFGNSEWVERTARALGLQASLHPLGRRRHRAA